MCHLSDNEGGLDYMCQGPTAAINTGPTTFNTIQDAIGVAVLLEPQDINRTIYFDKSAG